MLNLIEAGVRVVQLKPTESVYDENVEPMALMMAIMELSRGHSESAMKSDRVGKAWARKKDLARQGSQIVTKQLPGWVRQADGKLELVPERVAAVRRIFKLAADGYGFTAIVVKLNSENVPPIGSAKQWGKSYVASIVTGRRALGEYQPCMRDGTPDGDVIPNYFPAAVTPEQFYAAQAAVASRRNTKLEPLKSYDGRPARRTRKDGAAPGPVKNGDRHVNVFAGLMRDAINGDGYVAVRRNHPKKKSHTTAKHNYVLANADSRNHGTACRSFSYPAFEKAILKELAEVKAGDVLGTGDAPDETVSLSGELADVESRIAKLEAELLNGDVAALARVLRQMETRRGEVAAKLAEARQRAASPIGEAWSNCQTLLAAVEGAADPVDVRIRLRSVLRRVVDRITVVIVSRGRARLCAAQVNFASGTFRTYAILFDPPRCNHTGETRAARLHVRSFADIETGAGEIDLRLLTSANKIEEFLTRVNVEPFAAALAIPAKKSPAKSKARKRK